MDIITNPGFIFWACGIAGALWMTARLKAQHRESLEARRKAAEMADDKKAPLLS